MITLKKYIQQIKQIKETFSSIYNHDLDDELRNKINLLANQTSELFKIFRVQLKDLETFDELNNVRNIDFKIKENKWCSICGPYNNYKKTVEVSCIESSNKTICVCPNCIKKIYLKYNEKS